MSVASLGVLAVKLRADTSGLAKATMHMKSLGVQADVLGKKMAAAGRSMTMRLTLPIVGFAALGVKGFADFDSAMTQSLAIMGEVSDTMKKDMANEAKRLAVEYAIAPAKLAEAYYFLASAGLDASQSIAALPGMVQFAKAGMFDLAEATSLSTDVLSAFGLKSADPVENLANLTMVTDKLVVANTLADASVEQFAQALGNEAAAAAKNYGVSLDETIAVLSAYAEQSIKGEAAGSLFSRMLRLLAKSASEHQAEFEALGVSVVDSAGNFRNMADVSSDLSDALKGMSVTEKTAAMESVGFQARVQQAIFPILNMKNELIKYQGALANAGGMTKKVADKQMLAFSEQMKKTWIITKSLAAELGEALAPAIIKLGSALRAVVMWFKSMPSWVKQTIAVTLALAAALGPLLWISGGILQGFGAIVRLAGPFIAAFAGAIVPILATAAAIAAVGAVIVQLFGGWDAFKDKAGGAFDYVKEHASDWFVNIKNFLKSALIEAKYVALGFWTFWEVAFTNMFTALRQLGGAFGTLWSWIKDNWKKIMTGDWGNVTALKFEFDSGSYQDVLTEFAKLEAQKNAELAGLTADSAAEKIKAAGDAAKAVITETAAAAEGTTGKLALTATKRAGAVERGTSAAVSAESRAMSKVWSRVADNSDKQTASLAGILDALGGNEEPEVVAI